MLLRAAPSLLDVGGTGFAFSSVQEEMSLMITASLGQLEAQLNAIFVPAPHGPGPIHASPTRSIAR